MLAEKFQLFVRDCELKQSPNAIPSGKFLIQFFFNSITIHKP